MKLTWRFEQEYNAPGTGRHLADGDRGHYELRWTPYLRSGREWRVWLGGAAVPLTMTGSLREAKARAQQVEDGKWIR